MDTKNDSDATPGDLPADPAGQAQDDRRSATDPASDPRPLNPDVDDEAVAKGRAVIDRL